MKVVIITKAIGGGIEKRKYVNHETDNSNSFVCRLRVCLQSTR